MASVWAWLSILIFIIVLFLIMANPDFRLKKVGFIFWIISMLSFLYGFLVGSLVLMFLAIVIIYLRGTGKLGA
jgi:hypothetical protein